MPVSETELDKLTQALSNIKLEQAQGRNVYSNLTEFLPPRENHDDFTCGLESLSQLVLSLANVATHAIERVNDKDCPLDEHAKYVLVASAIEKLNCDGYGIRETIGAIATEHARISPALIVAAWQYACVGTHMSAKTLDQTTDYAQLWEHGIMYGDVLVRGADDPQLRTMLETRTKNIPQDTMQGGLLEMALDVAYDNCLNMLAEEDGVLEAEPFAILAVGLLLHLSRMGYDKELALKSLAVTDACALYGASGGSPEAAWWAALIEYPEDTHREVMNAWRAAKLPGVMEDMVMTTDDTEATTGDTATATDDTEMTM